MPAALSHITMIGCGNMGQALALGYLSRHSDTSFMVVKPSPVNGPLSGYKQVTYMPVLDTPLETDMVVLGVKPQVMDTVLAEIAPYIAKDTLVISIAAGKTIEAIRGALNSEQPIARVMPNTPAMVGQGMHTAIADKHCSTDHKEYIAAFFEATGRLCWIEDETLMDAVTALAGSGPAYIFYFMDVLSQAGEDAGLPRDIAETLARQTMIGAGALADNHADTSAAQLRENVTSPGGTTAAALEILMNGEMQDVFTRALKAATARGKELSEE